MRTLRSLGLVSLLVPTSATLITFACSPAVPPPIVQPIASASATPPKHDGPDTPSRWQLTEAPRWRARQTIATPSGTLEVGAGGERWLTSGPDRQAASTLLPADVLAVQKDAAGYLFLLADGSLYTATEPLGPATRAAAGKRNSAVAFGKASVLLVDEDGALQRSTDRGKTYTKVAFPIADGVITDVAMQGNIGFALMVPQRLWLTGDDGASWAPIGTPGENGLGDVTATADGRLLAGINGGYFAFDSATRTFTPAANVAPPSPPNASEEARVTKTALDGKHAATISGLPFASKREWSVAVGEIGAMPAPKPLDELTGCDAVDVAVRGDIVEIACDARGTVDKGVDAQSVPFDRYQRWGGSTRRGKYYVPPPLTQGGADAGAASNGNITKLLRSEDGGKTFKADGVFDGGGGTREGADGVVVGDNGWVFLGERCTNANYETVCRNARVRATATGSFEDLPTETSRLVRFAVNAKSSDVYAIGTGDEVTLYRFKSGAPTPERVTRLAANVNEATTTLTLDDDGVVRGFVAAHDGPYLFSLKPDGKDVTEIKPPTGASSLHAALAGKYGLAIGDKAYETTDEGKTWVAVMRPSAASAISQCSTFGCITDRGARIGWDGAETQPSSNGAFKNVFAKGLKCTAQGKWTKLGGGSLASVDDVDVGSSRWLLPTRDEPGRVTLHVNKRGDATNKTTDVPLVGPALQPPQWGAETVTYVQPTGVVVRRYTYSKIRKEPGVYNPVDASLVWYRGDTGKISRGAVNKIPPFRVQHDPRFDYQDGDVYPNNPEVVSLDSRGVTFVSQSYEDDRPMYLLRDDGRVEKQKGFDVNGDFATVTVLNGDVGMASVTSDSTSVAWRQSAKTFVWHAADSSESLFDYGGRLSILLGRSNGDARHLWAVPVKPEIDPSEWFALPTQLTFGDAPKPCDGAPVTDGSRIRYAAPWATGSRRAIRLDVDGSEVVLATDRMLIEGSTKAPKDACVSAIDARSTGDETMFSTIVFPDDLAHSLVFSVNKSDPWPETILVRPMECAFAAGPLPDALREMDGFYTGTPAAHSKAHGNDEDLPLPRPYPRPDRK